MQLFSTKRLLPLLFSTLFISSLSAQQSVMREWNELLLKTMGEDLNRPNVQARNIFQFSIAMYDAWAVYDDEADTYLLGKKVNEYTCPFTAIPKPKDVAAARREAMSFAAYRFLLGRFSKSPQTSSGVYRYRELMQSLGYDILNYSSDYKSGSPAAVGSYIAQCVLQMGDQDGSYEEKNYLDPLYHPVNPPLEVLQPGVGNGVDPNRWQPLKLKAAIDYDGYPVYECSCRGRRFNTLLDSVDEFGRHPFTGTQTCQGADWGHVKPFALQRQDMKVYYRNRHNYTYYHEIGDDFVPRLDTVKGAGTSQEYQWNYALVAHWTAFFDQQDTTQWDISPRSTGNVQAYPKNRTELHDFYNLQTGRDPGIGYLANPKTGRSYVPNTVPRSDFLCAATNFWAEGPDDQTLPGHWLTLLNYVSDQPGFVRKFNGKGRVMDNLEWDVKACFVLGGALHDAAIAAWGLKGRYESALPITALRYMASKGQSSDPNLPSYSPAGLALAPGRVELVQKGDSLAGPGDVNVGKVKLYTWQGYSVFPDTSRQRPGVGWVLGENWYPPQPKQFVSPPYGGFVSGQSALSHAAAEVLGLLTGDPWFPGGLGQYTVKAGSQFQRLGLSASRDVTLQWATYRDAADQASIATVWGGVNAPFDDIPGRIIGDQTGKAAFQLAKTCFYKDKDGDGYLSFEDCDDTNPEVHPGAEEKCNQVDDDCDGVVDPDCGRKKH